ncbi:chromate efflux transporter [Chitinophaga sp. Cy-1792]|uniref:chromate efflux transporter n=1 Tax=Chitinophaga sp. Cy-1792 TaxID=2608339 RepID=UPI0014238828|nr:chromate efflux transporter [Chitinophaga sp. Cy-1792]NIG57576.1 chromate efflux transporter [Chitinophaga sp. Cy-1792]
MANNTTTTTPDRPSFRDALKFWFKLGWISFGGTTGHISIMHDYLVEKRKWISNSKFLQALNSCMVLPGPEAQQLAIYIGWKLHGKKGGITAGTLFVLPSMFILLILSIIYVIYGNTPLLISIFNGLKPSVLAIILVATYKVGKKALHSSIHYIVALLTFALSYFLHVAMPLVILGIIVLSVIMDKLFPKIAGIAKSGVNTINTEQEKEYTINLTQQEKLLSGKAIVRLLLSFLALWGVPFLFLLFWGDDHHFWSSLVFFFTQTACITIGGSYTVIPYVAQLVVLKFLWLSRLQMLDGFALAETTPGPLIIVLSFVGFIAAYNHFQHSILFGVLGLLATTYFTFLPNFLFIFLGAPFADKYKDHHLIQTILSLVTAAVVGVILNLTFFLGRSIIFPEQLSFQGIDYISVGWVALVLFLLLRYNTNVLYVVLMSIIFGVGRYYFAIW